MYIKDLIAKLQELYESEMEHYDVMGEPEIMIDCFKKIEQGVFQYAGFAKKVEVHRSDDGVYLILNGFADD